jgi:hypothetical protein
MLSIIITCMYSPVRWSLSDVSKMDFILFAIWALFRITPEAPFWLSMPLAPPSCVVELQTSPSGLLETNKVQIDSAYSQKTITNLSLIFLCHLNFLQASLLISSCFLWQKRFYKLNTSVWRDWRTYYSSPLECESSSDSSKITLTLSFRSLSSSLSSPFAEISIYERDKKNCISFLFDVSVLLFFFMLNVFSHALNKYKREY